MNNQNISRDVIITELLIHQEKQQEEQLKSNQRSILLQFKQELTDLGFVFDSLTQAENLILKNKDVIIPLVIKYYQLATLSNEKRYLLGWFHHKGLEEAVPFLLCEYYRNDSIVDKWAIGDRLYQISSKKYIADYLRIISNPEYGISRQMVILLVGKLKVEESIPLLIDLLEDTEVRLHAICALGDFKKEEFRPYFERFVNEKHPGWRKYAIQALKKLKV